MTPITSFYPLVSGRLPNCPTMILRESVREACAQFAEQARLLMDTISVPVTAGSRFVEIESYEGEIFEVTRLTRDGNPLTPSSRQEVEDQGWDTDTGTPSLYYLEGDGRLVLAPVPDAAETLSANVLIRPPSDATEVHDVFYRDWRLAIAAGARAYVRRTHDTWANPALEAEDLNAFGQAISAATVQRAKGRTRRTLTVKGYY